MTWSYDVALDSGKVRVLDRESTQATSVFQDEEIDAFLGLEANDVFNAAALALDTIASNEVLLQKKIELTGITTDGPAVAASLRASAQVLRLRSAALAGSGTDDDALFGWDWAEQGLTDFNRWERMYHEWLRDVNA